MKTRGIARSLFRAYASFTRMDVSIVRPPLLARILDFKKQKEEECMDYYKQFLNFAEISTNESVGSKVNIAANYKLAGASNVSEFVGYNDNLVKIFTFYAKIQQTHHTTFSSADLANQTMNFKKFEIFCRDFKLIPKLLIREDIKMLWEMVGHDWVAAGKGMFVAIGFMEFKDMIVRMALLAYHKPGLKKLIVQLEGFMPSNAEIVSCFCNYLHLHDIEYIVNYIRTVGRKTQGDYNFRSNGEQSSRTITEVLTDKDARKLNQINRTSKAAPVVVKKAPAADEHHSGEEHAHSFGGSAPVAAVDDDQPKKGYNPFGEKIVVPLHIMAANPNKVIVPHNGPPIRRSSHSKAATLPQSLRSKLFSELSLPPINPDPATHETTEPRHRQLDDAADPGSQEGSVVSFDSSAMVDEFHDNSLEALRASVDKDYDPLLVKGLARYCYVPPKVVLSDTVYIGGPFVDLGLLAEGSKVTINLTVSNGTADDLHIDSTTRNFKSDDTHLKTFSKALIPGFTRSVQVTFTVQPGKKTVLAFIDIISVAVRRGDNSCISCPVFYRVDSQQEKDRMPHCTSESLQDLLGQFCEGRDRRQTVNFEQSKMNGTWKSKTATGGSAMATTLSKPRTIKIYCS